MPEISPVAGFNVNPGGSDPLRIAVMAGWVHPSGSTHQARTGRARAAAAENFRKLRRSIFVIMGDSLFIVRGSRAWAARLPECAAGFLLGHAATVRTIPLLCSIDAGRKYGYSGAGAIFER